MFNGQAYRTLNPTVRVRIPVPALWKVKPIVGDGTGFETRRSVMTYEFDPRTFRLMSMDWVYVMLCSNGRHWVVCPLTDDHQFWLNDHELVTWQACPHCEGWWDLTNAPVAQR